MDERVSVPLRREQLDWIERRARALNRPKAFVVRELIDEAARREHHQAEAA